MIHLVGSQMNRQKRVTELSRDFQLQKDQAPISFKNLYPEATRRAHLTNSDVPRETVDTTRAHGVAKKKFAQHF